MKVNLPKLPNEIFDFRGSSRRANDWRPLEPTLRGVIMRGLAKSPTTQSSESTGRLDASIRNAAIWRMGPRSVEWGTDVPYVLPVMTHRKKTGKPQIALLGPGVQSQVTDAVIEYILTGRR